MTSMTIYISIYPYIYQYIYIYISQVDCDRLFQSDILENSIHCGDQEPPKDIPPGTGGSEILLVLDPPDTMSEILLYGRVWNPPVPDPPDTRSVILLYRRVWDPNGIWGERRYQMIQSFLHNGFCSWAVSSPEMWEAFTMAGQVDSVPWYFNSLVSQHWTGVLTSHPCTIIPCCWH